MKGLSPKFPLTFDNTLGAYKNNLTIKEMIKQNVKNLLLTSPGERVMEIDFGVGIRRYFFEPLMPETYNKIATRISEQMEKYLPFVKLENISFAPKGENLANENMLTIGVSYSIQPIGETDQITIKRSTGF